MRLTIQYLTTLHFFKNYREILICSSWGNFAVAETGSTCRLVYLTTDQTWVLKPAEDKFSFRTIGI
jgi:hypothetical protein